MKDIREILEDMLKNCISTFDGKITRIGFDKDKAEKELKEREQQIREEAVRGFWKWLEQFPLVIGVNAEGDEPETYLKENQ